jgi:UDP-N-acetyl-D-galactosamine dehydrogenase
LSSARRERTIGFDIALPKVESCKRGVDPSRELPDEEMRAATYAEYTADPKSLGEADIIIVAVPTPVDQAHIPISGRSSAPVGRPGRT